MKQSTLLVTISILIFSCSKQQKTHTLVKHYLDSVLNDPHSYESVEFSKIDTEFKKYEYSDPEGINESKKYDEIELRKLNIENLMDKELAKPGDEMNWRKYNSWEKEDKILTAQVKKWENYFEQKNQGYKGPIKDFIVFHTYRAKNGFGALGLYQTEFTIDSAFTRITGAENLNH